jgi:hypothetical protein
MGASLLPEKFPRRGRGSQALCGGGWCRNLIGLARPRSIAAFQGYRANELRFFGVRAMKYKKTLAVVGGLLGACVLVFASALYTVLEREPYSTTSPSGRYLLQHASAGGLLVPFGGKGYLQIIDLEDPDRVYRTPLIRDWTLDLRMYEDDNSISIFGLEFIKATKTYIIQWPDWQHHWLDWFISNTPYEFCQETDGNCF